MIQADNLAQCHWLGEDGLSAAQRILEFISSIGILIEIGRIEGICFLPGLAIVRGRLHIDPNVGVWPGDVLHEAGHIAVMEPETRAETCEIPVDGGSEMAAIAWSVAAAQACNVGLDVLFHRDGYKGDSEKLTEQFSAGTPFGVPLLAWYGMTGDHSRDDANGPVFPEMSRWLR